MSAPPSATPDGLALSSRNVYLDAVEREAALFVHFAHSNLPRNCIRPEKLTPLRFEAEFAASSTNSLSPAIDYISVADAENLNELETITGTALVSLAVRIGKTRLIDNVII